MTAIAKVVSVINRNGDLIMQIKAIVLCAAVAAALNLPLSAAEQSEVPPGWTVSGNAGKQFDVGYDRREGAYYLKSVGDPGKAKVALTQTVDPRPYNGKSLELSADIKADGDVESEIFVRAMSGPSMSLGSSSESDVKWRTVTIEIARGPATMTDSLDFGFVLQGKGQIWVRNVRLNVHEDVAAKVDMQLSDDIPVAAAHPLPVNLELRP